MTQPTRLLLILLALILLPNVQAQPVTNIRPLWDSPRNDTSSIWLERSTKQSQDSSHNLYQQAKRLNQQQRYQESADLLERLLMFEAQYPGARQLYQQTLKQLEQQLTGAMPQQTQISNHWQWQRKIGISLGGGSNLNKAPLEKSVTLTLPEQKLDVILDKKQQPQAGLGEETLLFINAARRITPDQNLSFSAQLQHRVTEKHNYTDYLRFNTASVFQQRLNSGDQAGIALFTDILQYDNEERFYMLNLLGRYSWHNNSDCQPHLGLDWQWQHQKDTALYDMIYSGISVAAECRWHNDYYKFSLNGGREWTLNERPGGDQWRIRASLEQRWRLHWLFQDDQLSSYLDITYQKDINRYSALLDNGSVRNMVRFNVVGQYRWPLYRSPEQHWWGKLKVGWEQQHSNLELFEYRAFDAWIGIEVIW